MKNNIRLNKGITLIALVITIIVLLILAGVAIASITGNNGLLVRAETAKEETTKGAIKDELHTIILDSLIDSNGNYDAEKAKEKIQAAITTSGLPGSAGNNTGTYKGYQYTINPENLSVELSKDELKSAVVTNYFKEETTFYYKEGQTWIEAAELDINKDIFHVEIDPQRYLDAVIFNTSGPYTYLWTKNPSTGNYMFPIYPDDVINDRSGFTTGPSFESF